MTTILVQPNVMPSGCGLVLVDDDASTIRPITPCCGDLYVSAVGEVSVEFFCMCCQKERPEADQTFVRGRSLQRRAIFHVASWLGLPNTEELQIDINWG